jgi:hypothetical protein
MSGNHLSLNRLCTVSVCTPGAHGDIIGINMTAFKIICDRNLYMFAAYCTLRGNLAVSILKQVTFDQKISSHKIFYILK